MDVGVKHMAKFHLLLLLYHIQMILHLISYPLLLTYISTSMNRSYELVSLHVKTVICDKILPPADYLWGYEKNVSSHTRINAPSVPILYFNEYKVKEHKHTYSKTMSMIIKVIIPA